MFSVKSIDNKRKFFDVQRKHHQDKVIVGRFHEHRVQPYLTCRTYGSQVAVLFALVALAVARPDKLPTYSYSPPSQEDSHESLDIFETPKYEFTHAVKDEETANDFGHQEARDDEHTQGSYYVQLSDGRLQKVTYYVDGDSGFIAEVSYEGEARYPEPDSSEERFYAAPAPSPPQSLYGAPSK
ncbi:uncharacterized protein LOC143037103 [Oratosquilla oratoria]|uniref:uncharacterized protein LOC143037103 n=1 Tax=Oratosquilla oratoria TaxID=337810 RepID=UPI003F7586E9